ncbi:restriction endonuclease subunit S [Pontiellaceae bacterium B12219]|nr:restriction endonuclease subunit S [Pontiellaceae bacterium B12219]
MKNAQMKNDWVETTLGELFFTTSGGTPSRKYKAYYEGTIPWVKSGELDKGLILDTEEKITEEAIKNSSAKKFPEGTLLIALYGATIGKLAFLGVEAATNQAICGIFENDNFNSKFLYNYLLFRKPKLISQGSGGAQPNISQTILKKLKIPLAPLPEQRAIVAKIEALFSDLDSGVADLKTAQAQLKIYRQAVLKKAFEGGRKVVSAQEVTRVISDGDHQAPPKATTGIPFIVISNIKKNKIDFTHTKFVPTEYFESLKETRRPQKGDVLYTVTGSFGIPAIVSSDKDFCFQRHIGLLRPNERISSEYLFYVLQSPDLFKQANEGATGTAQKTVSLKNLRNFKIPLCSLEEQRQIVKEIEARLSVCDEVEETIFQALEKAEALRQSILKKAFEGRLLSDEELAACRAEPDWVSAAELLEKN